MFPLLIALTRFNARELGERNCIIDFAQDVHSLQNESFSVFVAHLVLPFVNVMVNSAWLLGLLSTVLANKQQRPEGFYSYTGVSLPSPVFIHSQFNHSSPPLCISIGRRFNWLKERMGKGGEMIRAKSTKL